MENGLTADMKEMKTNEKAENRRRVRASRLLTPGLDNTHLFMCLTAGAGTLGMCLLSSDGCSKGMTNQKTCVTYSHLSCSLLYYMPLNGCLFITSVIPQPFIL